MTDHKNTILAFVLSLIVVIGWEYYFARPEMEKQAQTQQDQTQPNVAQPGTPAPGTPAPGANAPAAPNAPSAQPATQTRIAVIAASPRVIIDTPRLHGSIDLKGGRIDDLSLEQYRETTDPNSPAIVLLSPSDPPPQSFSIALAEPLKLPQWPCETSRTSKALRRRAACKSQPDG